MDDLRTELREAILECARAQQLGDILDDELVCIETKSERSSARRGFGVLGSRGSALAHYSATLLAPPWFIWAVTRADNGATAHCAHLGALHVKDYDLKPTVEDDGITIMTRDEQTGEHLSVFIGLAPGPIAERFKSELRAMMQRNNGS